jgi:hypothetical protein
MNRNEFIDMYKQLTPEQNDELIELIQLQKEKAAQIADLEAKFHGTSLGQMNEIEKEQNEFLQRMSEEELEIEKAVYATDDPEEAFSLREMDFSNLQDEHHEILTTSFPIGIEILENEIEQIEDKMAKLLP